MTKKNKTQKEVEITEVILPKKSGKPKLYLTYFQRIFLYFVFIILLVVLGILFSYYAINFQNTEKISYTEKGNIDYKVHLKQNDFYESEYLDKNMSYVASLINDIKISFNYSFVADKKIDFDINYELKAKLIISNSEGTTNFYEKEYKLLESTKEQKENIDHYTLNQDITIDYDYYNNIANAFRSQYDISTNSYLQVYLNLNKTSESISIKEPTSKLLLNIPLSQKAINIKMDSSDIKNVETLTLITEELEVMKPYYLILGLVLIIVGIILLIKALLLINKSKTRLSPYDKQLSKILKEYDRFISIVKKIPNFEGYKKTDINSFYELLDIRDSLNKVIMFYEITKHHKSLFYLVDGNELYIYTLKAVDIENETLKG